MLTQDNRQHMWNGILQLCSINFQKIDCRAAFAMTSGTLLPLKGVILAADSVLHSIVYVFPMADTKYDDHSTVEFKNNAVIANAELPVSLQCPP